MTYCVGNELVACTKIALSVVLTPVAPAQLNASVVEAVIVLVVMLQTPKIIPEIVPFVLLPPTTKLVVLATELNQAVPLKAKVPVEVAAALIKSLSLPASPIVVLALNQTSPELENAEVDA